jgi:hypothetical protein
MSNIFPLLGMSKCSAWDRLVRAEPFRGSPQRAGKDEPRSNLISFGPIRLSGVLHWSAMSAKVPIAH